MEQAVAKTAAKGRRLGGKYLTFRLAGESYGLEILTVREIIGLLDITPVPCTPDFVLGVINLRGKVIPVIDLRQKFGMPGVDRTRHTCIIVVDIGALEMGIMVDSVSEVQNIGSGEIEHAPSFGANIQTEFILGMGKSSSHVTIILDIARVLTSEEIAVLKPLRDGETPAGRPENI